ncbi:MAG: hypothetical protein WAK29_01690 [Terriglobales bacterium]
MDKMQTLKISGKLAVMAMAASVFFGLTAIAMGQSDGVRAIYLSAGNVPTNLANIHTYAEPPRAFNPLTAADEELATYGFPTRPDKQADPDHYRLWERAMTAAKIHWQGDLKPMSRSQHGMSQAGSVPQPVEQAVHPNAGPQQWSNINAAGVILNNNLKKWNAKTSFGDIWTLISVPTVQVPFDNTTGCTETYYFDLNYIGIDGYLAAGQSIYFNAGEQAGVQEVVNCSTGTPYYNMLVGWGDLYTTGFALNPGDIFYTELHAFGGCNNGSAFVEDLTTLTYSTYTIQNDCVVPQVGSRANWVVDRLCCDGPSPNGVWPLANTGSIFFDGGAVENQSGALFYPGSQAALTQVLTMTDDVGDQAIELTNQGSGTGYEGEHALFFQTTGCAWSGGCTR